MKTENPFGSDDSGVVSFRTDKRYVKVSGSRDVGRPEEVRESLEQVHLLLPGRRNSEGRSVILSFSPSSCVRLKRIPTLKL